MPHTTIRTALPFLFALCLVLLSACQPATRPSPDARPPLLILVSIDGFRADYLDQELTPTLWQWRKPVCMPKRCGRRSPR